MHESVFFRRPNSSGLPTLQKQDGISHFLGLSRARKFRNLFNDARKATNLVQLDWQEVVSEIVLFLRSSPDNGAKQTWTMLRGCTLQVIRLERNLGLVNLNHSDK